MGNYVGTTPEQLSQTVQNRFFYGLRRTDNGELFLAKADQLLQTDVIEINIPGDPIDNYDDFQDGQDFFEGRDIFHVKQIPNLKYEQYRWDNRDIFYYINNDGEFVLVVNDAAEYDDLSSSDGNQY